MFYLISMLLLHCDKCQMYDKKQKIYINAKHDFQWGVPKLFPPFRPIPCVQDQGNGLYHLVLKGFY